MKTIALQSKLSDEEADALGGTLLGPGEGFDTLIEDDAEVLKPNGERLLIYRTKVLTAGNSKQAYTVLRRFHFETDNRGMAGGIVDPARVRKSANTKGYVAKETRLREVKQDGSTLSNVSRANLVPSGIIGYFDRNPRFPYCRQTAFVYQHPEEWAKVVPFLREVSEVFAESCPERYSAQKAFVERTSPEFVIPGTVFTTVTVNRNFQTACHKDAGDLKEGFGVMTCFRAGIYRGGFLVFPQYRVAVNMTTGCVLLSDVHEWHCNTPIEGRRGTYERLSCVCYFRERMHQCGSPEEERERAKSLRPASAEA